MKEEIQKFFKGEVMNDEETLAKYSHDASIFEIMPAIVLFPKDSEDVQNLVKWVNENKEKYPELAITARCAGTDMSGGSIGESLILDFTKYMNQVIAYDDPEKIVVQPGMFYRDFEKITLEKGMILPCYTASKTLNAVGGMYGNNSAGERTLRYGKTDKYVVEAKVVFSDGNEYTVKPLNKTELEAKMNQGDFEGSVYKKVHDLIEENQESIRQAKPNVSKNSAGYALWNVWDDKKEIFDLNKALVGSQGTLGIATEITFKLVKDTKHTRLMVVFLRDMNLVPRLVNKLLAYNPQTIESYDDKTFFIVLRFIKGFAKLLGLKNLFRLIFSFGPETKMFLRHGMPKLIMLVEFTGETRTEADQKAKEAFKEMKKEKKIGVHLTRGDFEAKKYWTIRRQAFNLIRFHLKKLKSKPFIDDVAVRPEKLPEFFPKLYKILGEYKDRMTFAVGGHSGDGNMHIYTLVDPKDPNIKDLILEASDKVYDMVAQLDGTITAEHNDGLIRTPYLSKMFDQKVIDVFRVTKETFDKANIFNPGKKVPTSGDGPGTKNYMANHISNS